MKQFDNVLRLPVHIHPIDLGTIIMDDPSKEVHRYIEIDEIQAVGTSEAGIILKVSKFHIQEYPIHYCKTCLQNGIRNEDYYTFSSNGTWCKEHYAEMVRKERPEEVCPKCKTGFLIFGTGDMYCSHCDHREPHKHTFKPGEPFMCTCSTAILNTD